MKGGDYIDCNRQQKNILLTIAVINKTFFPECFIRNLDTSIIETFGKKVKRFLELLYVLGVTSSLQNPKGEIIMLHKTFSRRYFYEEKEEYKKIA